MEALEVYMTSFIFAIPLLWFSYLPFIFWLRNLPVRYL